MKRIATLHFDDSTSDGVSITRISVNHCIDIDAIVYITSVSKIKNEDTPQEQRDFSCEIGLVGGQTITVPLPIDRVMSALVNAV